MSIAGFKTSRLKEDLKNAGVSDSEISIIIPNLENLMNAGVSSTTIEAVISKIMVNQIFRTDFINDPKKAILSFEKLTRT